MKNLRTTMKHYRAFLKKESDQTRHMLVTFKEVLEKQMGGNKNPSQEDIDIAFEQLKDIGKITALLPLVALPGSVITIPLLIKLGKRYNIDILPSKKQKGKFKQ